jgi:acyl-coenzyme A thioesterase PaaI-like protein
VHPDESVYSPLGVIHGGLVCTLADTAAACAVHGRLLATATSDRLIIGT